MLVQIQQTMRTLLKENQELKAQAQSRAAVSEREVRLREDMKRIIAVLWEAPPAAAVADAVSPADVTGYSAQDLMIGLESGAFGSGGLGRTSLCAARRALLEWFHV